MHYEIEATVFSGKPLTVKQRLSPFFTDCPRIGHHIIRDRTPLRLSPREMEKHNKDLRRLFDAEVIEIFEVYEASEEAKAMGAITGRINIREAMKERAKLKMLTCETCGYMGLDDPKSPHVCAKEICSVCGQEYLLAKIEDHAKDEKHLKAEAKSDPVVPPEVKAEALKMAEAAAEPGDLLTPAETVAVAEKVVEVVAEIGKVLETPAPAELKNVPTENGYVTAAPEVVQPAATPATVEPAPEHKKSKKGRKE
jgi:hypothetical protein